MRLLVVDDEDLIRKAISRFYQLKGSTVFSCEKGVKALEVLAVEKIDLVILDLLMPEKNGFDVLDEMPKNIPVVVISALSGTSWSSSEHFHSEDYPQVIGFIKKPFDHLNLVSEKIESLYANYIRKV